MKSFLRFAFVFILLSGSAFAQSAVDKSKFLEFHRKMIHIPLPGKGCFKAQWPEEKWSPDVCATPLQWFSVIGPGVGPAGNPIAEVTSGLISKSIGSFESLQMPAGNSGNTTSYSLQLNSQHFDTPACVGAVNPFRCKGWQQFVYHPDNSGFVQYWLLNYGCSCPDGWMSSRLDCTRFSQHGIGPGHEKLADLVQLTLGGSAEAGGMDTLTLGSPSRGVVRAMNEDNILGLASGWRATEFGVFGNGGGSQLTFPAGTSLVVRTIVDNGTTNAPKCKTGEAFTGETNNLQLVDPCCTFGGEAPAILFRLSNDPNATSECPAPRRK